MKKYVVWSQDPVKLDPSGNPLVMCELSRTEKSVAYHDAELIRGIIGRKAWVQETEERS